jgi:hypothetical protein
MDSQQNVKKFDLAIVVLETVNSSYDTVKEFLPEFVKRMETFNKGFTYRIKP